MSNDPKISVIVTTYNRKELLGKTVRAILGQSFKNFELIVVDNFSNYDFKKFMLEFKDIRIRPFQNENNGIIAINRNFGLNKSKGKYVAFCDDDDIWLEKKLEKQLDYISNSNFSMVFSMQKHFGHTNIFSNNFGIGPLPMRVDTSSKVLLNRNCISTSSVLLDKKILKKSGVFDESKSLIALEDNDLWIRISKISSIGFVPEILVMHRNHSNSLFSNSYTLSEGFKKINLKNGINSKKKPIPFYKNNFFYFFLRNCYLIIIEKIYYP